MSGFRRVGNILLQSGTQETAIPSSKIEPEQPLRVTVFPIRSREGGNIPNVGLRLKGNAPNLPFPSRGFANYGSIEQVVYNPVETDIDYTAVVRGGPGHHLLEVSSEDVSNDLSTTAVSIGKVSDKPSVDGFVGRSDTDDWFKFEVSNNSQVRVTLDPIMDNAKLELYDRGLNPIDSAKAEAANNGVINQSLSAGDYLVRVTPGDRSANIPDGGQASTDYILTVQQVSGNLGTGAGGGSFSSSSQNLESFWNFRRLQHIFTANQVEIDDLASQPILFRREGNEFDVPLSEGEPTFCYANTTTDSNFLSFEFESRIENSLPQFVNTSVAFNAYRAIGTTETRPADALENAIPVYRQTNLGAEQVNPLNILLLTFILTSRIIGR
ncbi:MAG: hypothetical protein F6K40_36360 [Okeania sp. SIO3I5]|uniref:PPC domain-containing protein n=1 Tax=Okeania sp. SIO3I5 TaxID=2607805 RepID=UPI0013BA11ED|nr:PPC domain-containing protein [Okeania sp. SIO3I5]NEQ41376.1 hypothetical protein [Okeania sp. SIO3I5]